MVQKTSIYIIKQTQDEQSLLEMICRDRGNQDRTPKLFACGSTNVNITWIECNNGIFVLDVFEIWARETENLTCEIENIRPHEIENWTCEIQNWAGESENWTYEIESRTCEMKIWRARMKIGLVRYKIGLARVKIGLMRLKVELVRWKIWRARMKIGHVRYKIGLVRWKSNFCK